DAFRQLSDKRMSAWKIERWVIHSVLVFVTLMTIAVIYSYLGSCKYWLSRNGLLISVSVLLTAVFAFAMIFKRKELAKDAQYGAIGYFVIIISLIALHVFSKDNTLFLFKSETLRQSYGFLIGSIFS